MTFDLLFDRVAEDETVGRLARRLSQTAGDAGLLDVAYRDVDSPLGPLLLAATPTGVVRLAFARDGREAVLQLLADRISPRILAAPGRLDHAARELEEYFAGRRRDFDVPLDLQLAQGFRRTVITALRDIRYGATMTYGEMAGRTNSPRAVRAVGTACARNPLPLLLPCHRVVRSDGSIGQYAGGPEAKRRLLELEATATRSSS